MRTWVWAGMNWSARVRLALDKYGDRITDISIFGWQVDAQGNLTRTFDPDLLQPYREKWPHIRFWLCFRNDGNDAIFTALRNSSTARARLVSDLGDVLEAYPWLSGIDIDLERGGAASNAPAAEALFRQVANVAHSRGLECSAALPPLTIDGSVGGEDWVRYRQLGQILDRMAIMSYDFAWSGSAPGPVSPGYWLENVYNWATSQVDPDKLMMGLPLYSYFWQIHDYPENRGRIYRGGSGTYYAAWQHFTGYRAWDGTEGNPGGSGSHHRIGWLAYRDPGSKSAWGFLDVYDWRSAYDWAEASGIIRDEYEGKPFTVRYGRPSGTPLWSIADNASSTAGAVYALTPRRVRAVSGDLVGPKQGFTLTIEALQRPPAAATILDDNAGTPGQLDSLYNVGSGSWSRWSTGGYHQYRGHGELNIDHDFDSATYLQVQAQFAQSGWAGVTVRGITAEAHPNGTVRLRKGQTVLGTAAVASRPVGAAAGSGRFVLGLRVREGSARVYFALSDTRELPRVLHANTTPAGGTVAITAQSDLWVDRVFVGDGWWYQPREAVTVQIGSQSRVLGRIPRTGVTWNEGMFRPVSDVDEWDTREKGRVC
ncbi:glycosyl hydrolase family 18 protein [Agrococcus casei]|uniref:Putative peptidoglycan hydrolase YvbX, NOT involved in spore germination n=1 Tax=Agrococcus casei LMG 22410 TaxID=1255656 RepID=A0A1R4FUY2_9MICO|nr:glycosyl hydrolase family 18 protein [Agrococcus casei]SJM59705.1 Putative peptidoglycan hydrolase YvbX, NOT involved in spore germination [Agrococcus casei LMG 22410]